MKATIMDNTPKIILNIFIKVPFVRLFFRVRSIVPLRRKRFSACLRIDKKQPARKNTARGQEKQRIYRILYDCENEIPLRGIIAQQKRCPHRTRTTIYL